MRRFLILLVGIFAAALARGQSIEWDPPGGSIAVGQAIQLHLVCRDCEPTNAPEFPKVPDLATYYQGPSMSRFDDNGVVSQSISYAFIIRWTKKAPLILPAFDVPTNHGIIHVASVRFEPAEATVGNSGKPLSAAANAQLIARPATVWAGQVVPLEYRIQAESSYRPDFAHQPPSWNADTFVAEEWSRPEAFESHANGDDMLGLSYRTRIIAPRAGTYELNSASQVVSLSVGMAMFGFFQSPQFQQYAVPSPPTPLVVRELPPAPADFSGAVGNFQLTSKVVPLAAGIREPITWTLELSGTGNWPQITHLPVRNASRDFQVVHPQLQHSAAPGKIFDAKLTEDVVLVPTKPGHYVLPPVHFVYFDPAAGEYRTISSPESAVDIAAPAPAPDAAGAPAASAVAPGAPPAPPPPALPEGLPRDPLPTGDRAAMPLGGGEWLLWAVGLPFAIIAAIWLVLARRRAEFTDPLRPRREARRRIADLVVVIGQASERGIAPAPRPLLLDWQKESARWRAVRQAVPVPEAFGDPAWTALAGDVDRALYGPDRLLPADWTERAEQALAAQPPPRFRAASLFLPRNLFPFFLWVLVGGSAWLAGTAHASPQSDYSAGNFTAAEKGWRNESPADPAARHDLSLALAQQGRWADAAAQSAAAFVQDPSNPVIRAQFATACAKAEISSGALTAFLTSGFRRPAAGLASPSNWQRWTIGGAGLFTVGAVIWLIAVYSPSRKRMGTVAGAILMAVGFLAAAGGIVGWQAYGPARDESAVWVVRSGTLRSIPTEADATQATVPLPAGSVAEVDKSFLGWFRLSFPNGTTGWVRKSEVVSLWK